MTVGIAMMMVTDDSPLAARDIAKRIAAYWPDAPVADEITTKDRMLSFNISDAVVVIAMMPAPIPWSELEGPCSTSTLWKNAAQQVRLHSHHWLITVNGELEPLELSTLLTQVTAATLAASKVSIGVYWGNATLVIPRKLFVETARRCIPDGYPTPLWVDFRVHRVSNTLTGAFTAGMSALGHMELEVKASNEPPVELFDRLVSLAEYLINNGPVIKDGDTIGADATEKIRVVYSKSLFGHSDRVMRLVYRDAKSTLRPWWRFW